MQQFRRRSLCQDCAAVALAGGRSLPSAGAMPRSCGLWGSAVCFHVPLPNHQGPRHRPASRIEIWFAEHGEHFYLVAESETANWVRNILSQPQVKIESAALNPTPSHRSFTMTTSLSLRPL